MYQENNKTSSSDKYVQNEEFVRDNIKDNESIKFNKYEDNDELRCDVCGMSYSDFLKTGIFGCPNCYGVFKKQTIQVIKEKIKEFDSERNRVSEEKLSRNDNNKNIRKNIISGDKKEIHKLLKELEELLAMCEKRGDYEKIEKIKKEIKRIKSFEVEKT